MNDASALHILLVDSRPDPVLARELEARDPLMVVSGDGHEALSLILRAKHTAPFSLVISALSLPGLDGLTLFRDLRRRQESMRLAFVLRPAELTPDLRHTCLKLECLPSLLRPVNVQAIGELLAAAQRNRGAAKEDGEPFFGTTTQRFRARGVSAAQPGADGDDAQPPAQGAPWQGGGQDALVAAPQVPPPMTAPVPPPPPVPVPSAYQVDVPGLPPLPGRAPAPAPAPAAPVRPGGPPPPSAASLSPIQAPGMPPLPQDVTPVEALPVLAPPPPRRAPPGDYSPANVPVLPDITTPPLPATPRQPVGPPPDALLQQMVPALDPTSVTTPVQSDTERLRRSADMFPEGESAAPSQKPATGTGTSRLRRTVTGTQRVERQAAPSGQPLSAKVTRRVACAYCDKPFVVAMKPEAFTIPCLHCGQVNLIQP
jgi:CheY-like chemotaxis protein